MCRKLSILIGAFALIGLSECSEGMKYQGKVSFLILAVAIGIPLLFFLLLTIWNSHQQQRLQWQLAIDDGRVAVIKMELIAQLIETARARTHLTSRMAYVTDIFEKDELNQELDRRASRFARLRQALLALEMSSAEQAVLDEQVLVIRRTLAKQREAADMIMQNEQSAIDEGNRLLMDEVYPLQSMIIDYFMELLDLQKGIIDSSREAAAVQYDRGRAIEMQLFVALCLFIVVAVIMLVRKILQGMQYESQAKHDELTCLLNRRAFEQETMRVLSGHSLGRQHVMGIIDLDHFKAVNDAAGHQAGDQLLVDLAGLMHAAFRKSDILARIGGDEFAFLMFDTGLSGARGVADELIRLISTYRLEWQGKHYSVGASIGIVVLEPDDSDYAKLFERADRACYKAKHEGRGRVCVGDLGVLQGSMGR